MKKTVLTIKINEIWQKIKSGKWVKDPIFWVRFSAYAIPLAFLLYVLYMNFLPFGYNKTFIIEVGGPNDTKVSEFYLEPAPSLSDRLVAPDGTPYRELNGSAFAIFEPKAILKDAVITVSVEGLDGQPAGVSLIPPVINLDPKTINWDYSWNFSENIKNNITPHTGVYQGQTLAEGDGKQITTHEGKNQGQTLAEGAKGRLAELRGNAFVFDGEMTFNGRDTRLELPNSADMFEDGPFTVYAEWEPRDSENNAQQIVGHYNWELWQNKDNVEFRVGRMNDAKGPAYSIKYPIDTEFFNTKHTALAIYSPIDNGYIDLYIDGKFAGRTYFGIDRIWKDYNGKNNLTFGKSTHGSAKYLKGVLHKVNIISENISENKTEVSFKVVNNDLLDISLISLATSTLKQIKINVFQR